jgi:hypothetical protein
MKTSILLHLFCLWQIFASSTELNAQVSFDVCIPISWFGGGTGEISFTNSGITDIPAGSTLELNWPGIVTISPWAGFSASGNNPFTLTITDAIPAGGSIGPLGFGFSSTGSYFTPSSGVLNSVTTIYSADPPCYVPP